MRISSLPTTPHFDHIAPSMEHNSSDELQHTEAIA